MSTILALLVAFAVTFCLAVAISGVVNKAYRQYQERYLAKSVKQFGDMFLFVSARQMLILNIASMILLGAIGYLVLNPIVSIVLMIAGAFLPMVAVKRYRVRRIRKFNAQLVEALQTMSNSLQAGRTFMQAAEDLAQEALPPLAEEFGLFVKEIKLGVPLDEALNHMSQRVGSDDLELVVVAANVSRELGGNMAEIFERIAGTIRERFRLEGKIDALTSQGKLQGWIVGAMPLALGIIISRIRPDLMGPMMHHLFGYVLVFVIALMELVGLLIIRRIVNIQV